MKWERVTDPRMLENGGKYVAVGADVGGLKMLDYGKERLDFHTSSKSPTRLEKCQFLLRKIHLIISLRRIISKHNILLSQ